MSNLLPVNAKKSAWRDYRARFLIAGAVVALFAAALSLAALAPSYLVLVFGVMRASSAQDTAAAPASQSDIQSLAQAQALLTLLSPLYVATTTPTSAIAQALADRPAGIGIDHVSFAAGSPSTIVLHGTSVSPEAVNAYQKALQADPLFASVSIPIGDLAGTAGGGFTATLSGNF